MATLARLAFSGIRSRLLASILTIVLAGTAAATVVLALQIGQTNRDPWQRTFDAAHGAHVLVGVPTEDRARALASLDGVGEAAEPVAETTLDLDTAGGPVKLFVDGLSAPPTVNAPVATAGVVDPGNGIVLERSLAAALGLSVGSEVKVGGQDLPVVGTAILPSQPRYPRSNPGLSWVSRPTLERLAPERDQWRWTEALRLSDPGSARVVADAAVAGSADASVLTWQEQRDSALQEAAPLQLVLTMYAMVLLAVVLAVVAMLAGARALQQHREIGLLKAVGLTPGQVTAVFVIESAMLGVVASVLGFAAGTFLAPRLSATAQSSLLGSPNLAVDPWALPVAAVPVVLVLILGSWVSTRRRTQYSVLRAIETGRAAPPSRSWLGFVLRGLPLTAPLVVGTRTLLAGRGRAVLVASTICLTGAAGVFALSMRASLATLPVGRPTDVPVELPVLVYTLDVVLLVISITALLAIALLSLRERLRDFAVLKTIGLTPREVAATLVWPYAALALVAGVLSVPAGIALYLGAYAAAGGDGDPTIARWPTLVLVPIATVALVLVATGAPARLATRLPAAAALRAE